MVIALFGLALAMIAGGIWAVVQGYEIILLERGWTMVIAGSVVATGGASLLGIAAAVRQLGRTRTELSRLRERMSRSDLPFPEPPRVDPMEAISAGLLAGGAAAAGRGSAARTAGETAVGGKATEGSPDGFPEAVKGPPWETKPVGAEEAFSRDLDRAAYDQSHVRTFGSEPLSGEFLPPALPVAWPTGSGRSGGSREGHEAESGNPAGVASPRDRPAVPVADQPAVRPHSGDAPRDILADGADVVETGARGQADAQPEKVAALRDVVGDAAVRPGRNAEAAAAKAMTVIGTYTSGANRYVMFSDGSIDAETPDGLFRFKSLDELKVFIAAGGEKPRQG